MSKIKMYCFKCEKDTIKEVGTTDKTIFFRCTICNHEAHVKKSLLNNKGATMWRMIQPKRIKEIDIDKLLECN